MSVDLGQSFRPGYQPFRALFRPEHMLMNTLRIRLIAAAFILPAAALISSPVMAASHTKGKTHHSSVHKASGHKSHKKSTPSAS